VCGDGFLGPNEGCDDGNLIDGDGCSANCIPEDCGNNVVDAG
jgi:cysteine-rich repeat protein